MSSLLLVFDQAEVRKIVKACEGIVEYIKVSRWLALREESLISLLWVSGWINNKVCFDVLILVGIAHKRKVQRFRIVILVLAPPIKL